MENKMRRALPRAAVLAACLAFALPASAEEAATPELEKLGTAIGDIDLSRKNCPTHDVDGQALGSEISRLGGERLNSEPYFQRAIRQRMMNGQGDLRREGPVVFCNGLFKKYGPEGSEIKGLLKTK
jgi:hypothetical protein